MTTFTIGKLAEETNINVETIRYYQRRGLIKEPQKPLNGFRTYSDEHIERIRFIKRAQELGFALDEIVQLADLGTANCNKTQRLAEAKLENIKAKIKDLRRLEKDLKTIISHCESNKNKDKCPLIQSLSLS